MAPGGEGPPTPLPMRVAMAGRADDDEVRVDVVREIAVAMVNL